MNEELEVEGHLIEIIEEDSYAEAASHRISDKITAYIPQLLDIGSIKQFKNLFYGERTKVDETIRVISDFAQIEIEIIGETKWIVVDVYIPEILERVQEILVEAELEMRQTGEDPIKLRGQIPAPNDTELTVMLDGLDTTASRTLSAINAVKGDALSRLRSAMDKEFIEPLDAKEAGVGITRVHAEATEVVKVLRLKKRMELLGRRFQISSDEEKALMPKLEQEKYIEIAVTESLETVKKEQAAAQAEAEPEDA
ncbi:MAG: hypothetical protein VW307_03600 [Alphaproteobacteria bacterium]